jgi:tRNA(adenine34) deaminase
MEVALMLANVAVGEEEVPVGAVVARNGQIISASYNRRIMDSDPTAHAEILALRAAAEALGDYRLTGCELVVTLEPCAMCAGAAILSRVDRVVYGATDLKSGAVSSLYTLCNDERLNHQIDVRGGVLEGPCGKILTDFFRAQRKKGKK